ncbi:DNA glycosylase [Hypoxylon trugodes]|uniref:DNA glycosylase n=1 Tax=Hypoxylon trugodes TaxID=326681 RepID=UPI0021918D51|nr:DNA glycosylase [Hypoxylon trugodes]KAI1386986.1 DNA glycosylase [Hypoxylon trugodes]
MDQVRKDYLSEGADDKYAPQRKLAQDYLSGFDAGDQFGQWYIGDIIVNGNVPEDELKHFTRHSLLRGAEQWEQTLACAESMKDKASFDDPLDGQDTLTFLTKMFQGSQGTSDQGTVNHYAQVPKGRKRLQSQLKTDLDQPTKKHGKNKQSPFWATAATQASSQQLIPLEDEKKPHEDRKARRSLGRSTKNAGQAPDQKRPIIHLSAERPALAKARKVHPGGNVITPNSDEDAYVLESVSGSGILRDISPIHTSADTEMGDSLKQQHSPLTAPNGVETTLDTTKSSLNTSSKSNEIQEFTTKLEENENTYPPSQALSQTPKRKTKSPYFAMPQTPSPTKTKPPRPPRGTISCIPIPPLDAPQFGLIQEELASDPFRVLVAVTFLIRVKGKQAIPVFYQLMEKYPTPAELAEADTGDIIEMVRHLGLAVVRAAAIQKYANIWLDNPPTADTRYGVKSYPNLGDGADVRAGEKVGPEELDPRQAAWEIGHMTQGRYAIDSWRIFCRDVLRGRAEDWMGKGGCKKKGEGEFQPEWMRVLPEDKELRACLRWMWMREGWAWNPKTGEKDVLSEEMRKAVNEGRVAYDDKGDLVILDPEEGS